MARNKVIEVRCDRCPRTEYLSANIAEGDDEREVLEKTHFKAEFLGETIVFEDLCSSCRKAVGNYLKSILKAKKEEEESDPDSPSSSDETASPSESVQAAESASATLVESTSA